jgi:hypothetical protein
MLIEKRKKEKDELTDLTYYFDLKFKNTPIDINLTDTHP